MLKDNLRNLMRWHGGLNVSSLARATGLPQPTIHQLYSGTTRRPREKTLQILADYFSVTTQQLRGVEPLPHVLSSNVKQQFDFTTAPMIEWSDLTSWPNDIDLIGKNEIIMESKAKGSSFVLTMNDASMEPRFPSGCLLIFDSGKEARDQDCILVHLDKTKEFRFKQLLIEEDAIYFQAMNTDSEDSSRVGMSKHDRVIATLMEARIKF